MIKNNDSKVERNRRASFEYLLMDFVKTSF